MAAALKSVWVCCLRTLQLASSRFSYGSNSISHEKTVNALYWGVDSFYCCYNILGRKFVTGSIIQSTISASRDQILTGFRTL